MGGYTGTDLVRQALTVDAGSRAAHLSAGFHKLLTTRTLERATAEAAAGAEYCCSNGVGAKISDHIILVLVGFTNCQFVHASL